MADSIVQFTVKNKMYCYHIQRKDDDVGWTNMRCHTKKRFYYIIESLFCWNYEKLLNLHFHLVDLLYYRLQHLHLDPYDVSKVHQAFVPLQTSLYHNPVYFL